MKKRVLSILLAVLMIASIFALSSCENLEGLFPDDEVTDDHFKNVDMVVVYEIYLDYMDEIGEEPLTYDEWFEIIGGDEFQKGIIPQIRENEGTGFWEISYNNGQGWNDLRFKTENEDQKDCKHTFDKWIIICKANEYFNGIRYRECKKCGYKDYQFKVNKDALDDKNEHKHSYSLEVTNPSCTTEGYTTYTCECGESYIDDQIPALGHTEVVDAAVAPDCTNTGLAEGKHCSVCNEVLVAQEVVPALGHNYTSTIVPPSETTDGCATYTCLICGDTYTETITPTDFTITVVNREMIGYQGVENEHLIIPTLFHNEGTWYKVVAIGDSAFRDCSNITHVAIPESVVKIDRFAFSNCDGLTDVVIPDSVTSIGDYAFAGCSSLTSVIIGDSVTDIYTYAFGSCESLLTVTIGINVKNVQFEAFRGSYPVEVINKSSIEITTDNSACGEVASNAIEIHTDESKLTMLGDYIFYKSDIGIFLIKYCGTDSSIILPEDINFIYHNAFSNCSNLTSVSIPNNVTTIGDYAFQNCLNLASIVIPDSVTSIGYRAFYGCTNLENIIIGANVISIDFHAFYDTAYYNNEDNWIDGVLYIGNHLIKVKDTISGEYVIKDGTVIIANRAFEDCTSLTSVVIPDSITTIGSHAFWDCDSLTNVVIPDSVTSISEGTFYNCDKLTSITIPDSITSIGDSAFSGCDSLTSVMIPDSVVFIGFAAFRGCSNLASVEMGDGVASIGKWAFDDCNLDSIRINNPFYYVDGNCLINRETKTVIAGTNSSIIPDGITAIASYSFSNRTKLITIAIPNSVTSIGSSAFYNCTSLTSVVIGDSVTSIGDSAFYGCTNLENIIIGANVISIDFHAFYDTAYYNNEDNWIDGVLYIGNHLIKVKDTISGEYVIKDGTVIIANHAFEDCTSLTSVVIPDSITTIGSSAFWDCDSLTSVVMPDSVATIGSHAFYDCDSLTNIVISDSIISIHNGAFANCNSLISITVGANNANYMSIDGNLYSKDGKTLIQYAIGKTNTSFEIPHSVFAIGDYAFSHCNILTNVVIANSVISIGDMAFYDCKNLTSVVIGASVTLIGSHAFSGCKSLAEIVIPDSVTSIGDFAFSGCSSLADVYYTGTKEDWVKISISYSNSCLTGATIHYNYVPEE